MSFEDIKTIYCVGRNYAKHAKELGNEIPSEPLIFLKSVASLRGLAASQIAFEDESFHHEVEVVLLIGKDLKLGDKVSNSDIQSIALGLDLTRRGVQSELKGKGSPWTTSKSFLGSALLGELRDPADYLIRESLVFELKVNGQLRQSGDTQDMLFSFMEICNYLNFFSPLKKGDLIYTGTPEGVGPFKKGDSFEMCFQGIGSVESGEL